MSSSDKYLNNVFITKVAICHAGCVRLQLVADLLIHQSDRFGTVFPYLVMAPAQIGNCAQEVDHYKGLRNK